MNKTLERQTLKLRFLIKSNISCVTRIFALVALHNLSVTDKFKILCSMPGKDSIYSFHFLLNSR